MGEIDCCNIWHIYVVRYLYLIMYRLCRLPLDIHSVARFIFYRQNGWSWCHFPIRNKSIKTENWDKGRDLDATIDFCSILGYPDLTWADNNCLSKRPPAYCLCDSPHYAWQLLFIRHTMPASCSSSATLCLTAALHPPHYACQLLFIRHTMPDSCSSSATLCLTAALHPPHYAWQLLFIRHTMPASCSSSKTSTTQSL